MNRGAVRIDQMRDQRDAGGPEPGVGLRARDLTAKFRSKLAEYRRDMNPDLFKQTPSHHCHDTTATRSSRMVRATPGRTDKPPRFSRVEVCRGIALQRLERAADVLPQSFEPGARPRLAPLECGWVGKRRNHRKSEVGAGRRFGVPSAVA